MWNVGPTMLGDFTFENVLREVDAATTCLTEVSDRALRLWERIRISPVQWSTSKYPGHPSVWVVALMGTRCLYLNPFERGWGWGRFDAPGRVSEHHSEQEEIWNVVLITLCAIDEGGAG